MVVGHVYLVCTLESYTAVQSEVLAIVYCVMFSVVGTTGYSLGLSSGDNVSR
jgi:hypothetical protein